MLGNPARPARWSGAPLRLLGVGSALIVCLFALVVSSQSQEPQHVARHLGPLANAKERSPQDVESLEWRTRRSAATKEEVDVNTTDQLGPGSSSNAEASDRPSVAPSASRRWRGRLIRNDRPRGDAPAYVVIDARGLKRRYVRVDDDVNLDRFVDREVTVLDDTGLVLNLEQIAFQYREPGTIVPSHSSDRLHVDERIELADFNEEPPRFRPRDAPVSTADASSTPPGRSSSRQETGEDDPGLRIAQHAEQLQFPLMSPTGEPIVAGESMTLAPHPVEGGICPICGQNHAASGCACGARGRWWGRVEFLQWWTDGMELPPLVTTSPNGTAQAEAGVLGASGTSVLFGNQEVLDGPFDGGRVQAGRWFGGGDKLGVEGDYLALDQEWLRWTAFGNNGSPILGRPFFNMLTAAEDSSLVAFPNLIEGTVTVDASSDLETAGLRLRISACCNDVPVPRGATTRIDLLAGYRFAQLDERLRIREDSISLDAGNPGSFIIHDAFSTNNEFHGGEAGVVWEWNRPRWSLELTGRVALGVTEHDVFIGGNTVVSDGGFSLSQTGGLLAQRSNIGHYERNEFSVLPELSASFAFKVTQNLRLTATYTFFYWSTVVRPGDQLDRDLNPNLLPPEANPFSGPLRPQFAFQETDYWAHGVSGGIDYRF